ncbi:MAG: hypothetical protein RL217_1729 [Pseudomonadota bacterium]|jgi:cytochrome b561
MHNSSKYHPLQAMLHWLTLWLLVAVYVLIEFKGIYPKGSEPRELMKHWHFMLGALVLVVTLVRLVLRAKFPAPAITPNPPAWMSALAKLMHVALYAFLIAMPVLGWLTLNAHGKAVPFFGLELPHLIDENKELGKQLKEMHETLGKVGYALIGLHALAAIYHHALIKDDTLTRMMPWKK